MAGDKFEWFQPGSRQEWRDWLAVNYASSPGIWLIFAKKGTGIPTVTYDEVVEECLCFGWIDSQIGKVDDRLYKQMITPRKVGSPWSRLNKTRVEKLEREGLLMPPGLRMIVLAKADGTWTVYDAAEDLVEPDDLRAALDANPTARGFWDGFSASSRKGILWYLATAKRPETRSKRIEQIVSMAARGLRAQFDKG